MSMSDSQQRERPSESRWWRRPWTLLVAGAIIALVAGFGGGLVGGLFRGAPADTKASPGAAGGACNSVRVAADILPTIVTISVRGSTGSGVGSGEIIRDSGYIVTNNHVISPAANGGKIDVVFSSGQQVPADLVGRDPKSDLAVLKVDTGTKLPTIDLGNSDDVVIGQPVVALGAPLGLSSTVTAGIVSALGRNVPVPSDDGTTTTLAGAIQTDASINPGNSGGALVDCRGDLIGVNTAIATVPNAAGQAGGGSVGIGFAVPANLMKTIVNQLITTGSVAYPYFGIAVAPISPAMAEQFGGKGGLFVESVVPRGPSDAAGLRAGDVITEINNRPAAHTDVLIAVTLTKKAGDTITVTYKRGGRTDTTKVTLGEIP